MSKKFLLQAAVEGLEAGIGIHHNPNSQQSSVQMFNLMMTFPLILLGYFLPGCTPDMQQLYTRAGVGCGDGGGETAATLITQQTLPPHSPFGILYTGPPSHLDSPCLSYSSQEGQQLYSSCVALFYRKRLPQQNGDRRIGEKKPACI